MIITVTYSVDADLYQADTNHNVSLTTTEYVYQNETLIRLQIGTNFRNQLNCRVTYKLNQKSALLDEQYLFKTATSQSKADPITRKIFTEKLTSFIMTQTTAVKEILEEYSYIGKNGITETVQIVITEKSGKMTAAIDFADLEQYKNFIAPSWLIPITE